MTFPILLLAFSFVGLAALFSAVALWWRETATPRQAFAGPLRLGLACLAGAGLALVAGAHYRLSGWSPIQEGGGIDAFSPRAAAFFAVCLLLVLAGVALRALGRRSGQSAAFSNRALVAWSVVAALILTLVELNAVTVTKLMVRGIPRVELDTRGVKAPAVSTDRYELSEDRDWVSRVSATWMKALDPYKGKPNVRYLEIGVYEGRSFLWMAENILTHPTARLTAIDPFLQPRYERPGQKTYKDVFYSNLKASGFAGKVEVIEGFSQVELRKLPLESYDLIYVDGSHESADVLEDAILSWRLLKNDGLLIFDDYQLDAGMKRAIDTFFSFFAEHFEPVHTDWQVIVRKKSRDRSVPGESK